MVQIENIYDTFSYMIHCDDDDDDDDDDDGGG